jgi:tripartite-type tricarboxylate transporter receptor subunit TctC
MRRNHCLMALVVVCSFLTILHGPMAMAQSAADFYKGKTIAVLVGTNAGASFDIEARTIIPFVEKYTGAKCLVYNMAAGGGLQARNKLFESKPDGLTIILSENGPKLITASLFNNEGVRYAWNKFVPLGKIVYSPSTFNVNKKLGYKTPKDLVGVNFICGTSAPFFEPLFAEALGWNNMKLVPGLSLNERSLAMRRGEIQATVGNSITLTQNGDIMVAIASTSRDEALFPGVPDAGEVAIPGKEKWAKYMDAADTVMFWAIAPPGMPKDRAAYLESVLKRIFEDPGFRPALAKVGEIPPPKFVPAARLVEMMNAFAAMSPEDIKEMEHVINRKYIKQ